MNHLTCIPACLRLLISGGDVLRGAYVDRLLEQAEVYNTYGPSETCVCASYYRCNGGICLYQEMPSPDNLSGQCAYLMNIYTCSGFRRRGVGEMIVRWLVRQAVQRNITKIYLETSGPGRKLYEKTGFLDMPDMMKLQTFKVHEDLEC